MEIIEGLTIMHFIMAYAGLFIHILLRLSKLEKGTELSLKTWWKENRIHTALNIVTIPVILVMLTDPAIRDLLPINFITATLAGYQAQSIFQNLVEGTMNRFKNKNSSK